MAQTTAPNFLQPHAHIAPLVEGASPSRRVDVIGKSSYRFNYPDGIWNHGEGFAGPADTGGYFGFDDGRGNNGTTDSLELANIVAQLTGPDVVNGWETTVGAEDRPIVRRYVGHLVGINAPQAIVDDQAAFEILGPAPVDFDASKPSILVVTVHGTIRSGWNMTYPGNGRLHGLFPTASDLVIGSKPPGNPDLNIFSASITPPQERTPWGFFVTRLHHLVRAVELLLDSAYPAASNWTPPDPITTMIFGGSAGGFFATMMSLQYPNRFHGALGYLSSASLRRVKGTLGAQDFVHDQMAQISYTRGFDPVRELQWNMGAFLCDSTMLLQSFPERWRSGLAASNPQVERPHYFLFSDEEYITTSGTEWINLIRNPGDTTFWGRAPLPTLLGNVAWGIREHSCHREQKGFVLSNVAPMPLRLAPRVYAGDGVHEAMRILIDEVVANVGGLPTPNSSPNLVAEPSNGSMTLPPGWILNPFDSVLSRPLDRPDTTPVHAIAPSDQRIISLAPGFPKYGQGLALRAMVIDGGSIYVGGGDGIVSKLQVDETTSYMPIVPEVSSPELGQDISDLALTADGQHLVVSTYRALYLLNTSDMTIFKQTDAAYNTNWKYSDPRSLKVAELTSSYAGEEIAYTTKEGGLFVRSADLSTEILNFPEPGILDIAVPTVPLSLLTNTGGPEPIAEMLSKPIFILSSRGHIASVELGVPSFPHSKAHARLRAISALQNNARPVGLSMSGWSPANDGITAYYEGTSSSFRFFEQDFLNVETSSISDVGIATAGLDGRPVSTIDFAIYEDSGVSYGIVIRQERIYVVDENGTIVGEKRLRSFAPAFDALAVRVGEVVASSAGPEIVISTRTGKVVWFSLAQLMASGLNFPTDSPTDAFFRSAAQPFPQSNESVAGGWAMDPVPVGGRIHFVDQSGAHWDMGLAGANFDLKFHSQIKFSTGENVIAPIFDMAHAGTTNGFESQAWTGAFPDPFNPPLQFELNSFAVAVDLGDPNSAQIIAATAQRIDLPSGDPTTASQYWASLPSYFSLDDNFIIATKGGDVTRSGSSRSLMQWSGMVEPGNPFSSWPNHVFRMNYDLDASTGRGIVPVGTGAVWGSGGEFEGVPFTPIPAPLDFRDLRSGARVAHSLQSLRLGDLKGDGGIYAAISTTGGEMVIIDPAPGGGPVFEYHSRAADRDYGYGGLGLAVGNLDSDPAEEIIFGNIFRHTDPNGSRTMDASLIIFDWDGSTFYKKQEIHLGELGLDPAIMPGFGIAGIAIANIDPSGPGFEVQERHAGNEVIVSTLNGELYVFATGGSPLVVQPIHASVHEGSLGGANSIAVVDLDGDGLREIYLASSRGIYRFDVSAPVSSDPGSGNEEGLGGVDGDEGGF